MQYKRFFAALSVLAFTACTSGTPTTEEQGSSSSAMMEDASSSAAAGQEESNGASADARIVDIAITDWSFTPKVVTAKKGEKVQLRLTVDQGIHSLLIADLGLNIRTVAGSTTVVDLPTDTAGTFAGRCGVPCGPGHRDMTFSVIVQ